MTISKWTFRGGLLLALLLASAGLLGCGDNSADAQTDTASAVESADAEQSAVDAEQDAAAREREAAERLAELEAREAAVAQREAAATKRTTSTQTQSQAAPTRSSRPATPPAPTYRTVKVTLPASTALEVEFAQSLSSEESAVGDPVRARVTQDVVEDGVVAVPAGSEVLGQVTEARAVKKIGGQAKLALVFNTLRLPSGEETAINSSIEFLGKKQTGKDAATIGGSAAGGAVLGRVLGGDDKDKATAIGAVVGAAVGTAVAASNKTDPVLVETGQVSQALLYDPVHLTVVVDAAGNVASR